MSNMSEEKERGWAVEAKNLPVGCVIRKEFYFKGFDIGVMAERERMKDNILKRLDFHIKDPKQVSELWSVIFPQSGEEE